MIGHHAVGRFLRKEIDNPIRKPLFKHFDDDPLKHYLFFYVRSITSYDNYLLNVFLTNIVSHDLDTFNNIIELIKMDKYENIEECKGINFKLFIKDKENFIRNAIVIYNSNKLLPLHEYNVNDNFTYIYLIALTYSRDELMDLSKLEEKEFTQKTVSIIVEKLVFCNTKMIMKLRNASLLTKMIKRAIEFQKEYDFGYDFYKIEAIIVK